MPSTESDKHLTIDLNLSDTNKSSLTKIDRNEEMFFKNDRDNQVNHDNQRYPYCIVWTPIPLLT